MELSEAVFIAIASGLMTGLVTVISMRTDVAWLKQGLLEVKHSVHRAHERIDNIEKKPGH